MKRHNRLSALALLCTLPGLAGAMQCTGGLAQTGTTKIELIAKCGQPIAREDTGIRKRGARWVPTEQWTYDRGYGSFYQIVDLEDGRVTAIGNGPRK